MLKESRILFQLQAETHNLTEILDWHNAFISGPEKFGEPAGSNKYRPLSYSTEYIEQLIENPWYK